MKHLCKALAMLLLTVLVGLSGLTAYAHDVPDESKKGSITVDFEYDNKAVTGGRLALYRIAKVRQTDGNYDFENLPEFAGFHKDMSDLTSAELARCLADFVNSHNILPVDTRDNRTGSVTFLNATRAVSWSCRSRRPPAMRLCSLSGNRAHAGRRPLCV